MPSKRLISLLFTIALLLPAGLVVVAAFARLLIALGDESGGIFLDRLALVGAISWILVLLALLLATTARNLRDDAGNGDAEEDI